MVLPPSKSWGLKVPGRPPTPSEGAAQHYSRIGPPESQKILSFKNGTTLSFGPDDPIDEFDEGHPFREQISSLNNCIQEIQPYRLRYQGAMNPDRDPHAAVWENFRTMTLDPYTQQTVTLDSGTYRQVPSRYATYRDNLSVYSNELYRPGYARRLMDLMGDARFGTGSGAELEHKRDIAKRAREMIKQEKETKRKNTYIPPLAAGHTEMTMDGEHLQDARVDPRYGLHQSAQLAASPSNQGHFAGRPDRHQPRFEPSYLARGRQYGPRRGRGYHARGGRSRSSTNIRRNQPCPWIPFQEPAFHCSDGKENNSENMDLVQGHTFGGMMRVQSHQAINMTQHAPASGQEPSYLFQVLVAGCNNEFSGNNCILPFTAEEMQNFPQISPPVLPYEDALLKDLSRHRQSGRRQRNQRQYSNTTLGQDATRSYPTAQQLGLGIKYDEQIALASADAQLSGGLGDVRGQNTYDQGASQSFVATRQFAGLGNTQVQVNSRPSLDTRRVDSLLDRQGQVTRHTIHPAPTVSSLNTPRFSEVSQNAISCESPVTSASTRTYNLASTDHARHVVSATPVVTQTYQAAPFAIQHFAGRTLSAISESVQPRFLATTPINNSTPAQSPERQPYAELEREYDQWLDEENKISERYDGPPVDHDRVPVKRYENMGPVLAETLRRMEEVDVHHEYQSLLTRRAAANDQTIVPPPFVPRVSSFQTAPPQMVSPQVTDFPLISVPQGPRDSQTASPQAATPHAPTPQPIMRQIAALQAPSPQIGVFQVALSPAAAHFSPDPSSEYVGYTIFGQQPGQVSRDPSPIPVPRRGGRRLYESGRSTPNLLRDFSYESHRSSPGPQTSLKFNRLNLNKGGPSS